MMINLSGAHALHAVDADLAKLGPCSACRHMRFDKNEDRLDCAFHSCGTKVDCTCLAWEGRDGHKPKLSHAARGIIAEGCTSIHPVLPVLEQGDE
jgi:hypothetical protein